MEEQPTTIEGWFRAMGPTDGYADQARWAEYGAKLLHDLAKAEAALRELNESVSNYFPGDDDDLIVREEVEHALDVFDFAMAILRETVDPGPEVLK